MTERFPIGRLTRRQFLSSAVVTGVTAAGAGAGTYAYLQDTEESSNNTIAMGTLDLIVSDGDEGFGDGVSGTWTASNMKPGDTVWGNLSLQNDGSLEADYVELSFDYEETESAGPNGSNEADTAPDTADGMAKQFEVITLGYDSGNILRNLSDANGNGRVDVDDLVASENAGAMDGLTAPPAANGGTEALVLELKFVDEPSNNRYQGDTLDITVTMALHQEAQV